MKRVLILFLVAVLFMSGCSFQNSSTDNDSNSNLEKPNQGENNLISLNALLIYDDSSSTYLNIFNQLNQSLVANFKIDKVSMSEIPQASELEIYDIVYVDSKVEDKLKDGSKDLLMSFVNNGGYIILENDLAVAFPEKFTGFKNPTSINKLDIDNLIYEDAGSDISESQMIFKDYLEISKGFKEYTELKDKGYSVTTTTAKSVITMGDKSLFTINEYGKGKVIYLSKVLLNDELFNDGFDFKSGEYINDYYNFSFASANMMMRDSLIKYVSKDIYGFSLSKVLGTNGRPFMAWQNHFEVLHSIKDTAMSKWVRVSNRYRQIPSYSLIRVPFNWGKWHETITYYTNQGENTFTGELVDSAYSSGRNVYTGNQVLMLERYPHYNGYYVDIEDCFRASPDIAYINDDDIPDLITGSSNGNIYLYYGIENESTWTVDAGQKLKLTNNTEINTNGSSVPILFDIDNDGANDIISGSESGKIYIYKNNGDMKFTRSTVLNYDRYGIKYSAPAVYDIDGDGSNDLIIGTELGKVYYSKGSIDSDGVIEFNNQLEELELVSTELTSEDTYTVPEVWDTDNDGTPELLLGTNDGYVRVYKMEYPKLTYVRDIEGKTQNRMGTFSIWGGHNSVPRTFDLDKDGNEDLIFGQLQFSYGEPMNGESFIYEKELRDELQYAKDNYVDFYPHTYFHSYKSSELENEELRLHKEAFEYYGLDWSTGGTNQHTWRLNEDNPRQSIESEMNNGIWWNSGYWYPTNPAQPSYDTQFVWTMPFMLTDEDKTENMILFSPTARYDFKEYYPYVGKYDMPMTYYYHIDEDVLNKKGLNVAKNIALELNKVRDEYVYNFNTEYQMAKSFKALFKTKLKVIKDSEGKYTITKISDETDSAIKPYINSIGVKLEEGEKMNKFGSRTDFDVEADIYYREGNNTFFALNKDETVFKVKDHELFSSEESHIVSVNLPVNISKADDVTKIEFLDHGLQEIRVNKVDDVEVISDGWEIYETDDYKTIYKYGDSDVLQIRFK